MAATMRAVVIARPGGPEVLERRELPRPVPAAGEVLVRIHATALNRADLLQRRGRYPAPPGAAAQVPGLEYAGEVAALGADVRGWREGDRVFGIAGGGTYAEYVAVPASTLARIPDGLSWTDAAAIPEACITAHDALVTQGGLSRGERVLVHAVGSGVGLAVAQVAHAMGARVFGTARTADKVARAHAFGMEAGFTVAGDLEAMAEAARQWGGGGVDVAIDLVGGDYVPATLGAMATKGRIVLVGLVAGRRAELPLDVLLTRRLVLRGTVLRSRSVDEKAAATRAFERDVVPLVADGRVRPVVDAIIPLDAAADGHARMERDETFGKVVLQVA